MTDTSSSKSSDAGAWADLWIDAPRRYWESWIDLSRKMSERTAGEAGESPLALWTRAMEFWTGLMAPPLGENARAEQESATDVSALGRWADGWIKAQGTYWENWLTGFQAGSDQTGAHDEADIGARLLEFWTTLAMPLVPSHSRASVRALLEANKSYFRMGEGLWKLLAANYSAAQGAENPWNVFSRGITAMQDEFSKHLGAGKNPWAGFATFWGMPLDNWRRVCSAFSIMPGDMEQAARGSGSPYGPETLHRTMVGMLSMPTVGYTREWQEELQRWGLLWLDHGQALQEYGMVLGRITERAIELFSEALRKKSTGNEPLESLRAFYNLWIDCSEEAYGEVAISPEFTQAQSRMMNSLFAIKRQEQKMVEEILSALNMPTRRELDTSHRRVHQLQRRVWQVEQALEEAGGLQWQEEIAALRREVASLRAALEAGGKPTPPRRGGAKTSA
jgi:class III poly(R)-hydroxyalkanoic acid synthase PhaE subunit